LEGDEEKCRNMLNTNVFMLIQVGLLLVSVLWRCPWAKSALKLNEIKSYKIRNYLS
jgi:hypothetical protein